MRNIFITTHFMFSVCIVYWQSLVKLFGTNVHSQDDIVEKKKKKVKKGGGGRKRESPYGDIDIFSFCLFFVFNFTIKT